MTDNAENRGRVFVFGSAHQDLVLSVPQLPAAGETVLANNMTRGFGGKGANQAIAAAVAGAPVTFIGSLGWDDEGGEILANLADHGIDTSWTRQTGTHPTGMAVVLVDSDGRNQIVVAPGASAASDSAVIAEVLDLVRAGDVILVQCEIPVAVVEFVIRAAAATAAVCVLNLAPYTPVDPAALSATGLIVVNESEASALLRATGAPAGNASWSAISAALATPCIVTLGEAGSVFSSPGGDVVRVPARFVEEVVDTTGAGDVYVGTLGALLASGATIADAMAEASTAAAESVLSRGAQSRRRNPRPMTDRQR
jgi:ribokinase